MKGPGILKGIVFAILASLAGGLLLKVLPLILSSATSSSLATMGLSLAYLLFLQRYNDIRQGRVLIFSVWIILSLTCWLLGLSLVQQILLNIFMIWIVRSLYFHSSITAALLDLVLVIMASGAGVWAAIQTNSPMAAVWSFFLCQSLFGAIPEFSQPGKTNGPSPVATDDHFQAAHRVAQDAVRKLSTNLG
ncbi:MAG: hypothetical protein GY806_09015 [Gammaproteobacteria bacterium]|nr:hypothetical protein [Gammaproteobacteria bacterium]